LQKNWPATSQPQTGTRDGLGVGGADGTGVNVYRAVAVIGVRPGTVFSAEQSHVDMSQSQSHEWPTLSMLRLTVLLTGVNV